MFKICRIRFPHALYVIWEQQETWTLLSQNVCGARRRFYAATRPPGAQEKGTSTASPSSSARSSRAHRHTNTRRTTSPSMVNTVTCKWMRENIYVCICSRPCVRTFAVVLTFSIPLTMTMMMILQKSWNAWRGAVSMSFDPPPTYPPTSASSGRWWRHVGARTRALGQP